jgi:thioredoxin-related protein
MKKILYAGLFLMHLLFLSAFTEWQPDFETAQKVAKDHDRLILLNFSGSDWCGPCIMMKKEIFGSVAFLAMADTSLVLVNADFPRNKKNQLPREKQLENDRLAEKYNPEGKFPFTLLLTSDGRVVKSWDGLPAEDSEHFSSIIQKISDDKRAK